AGFLFTGTEMATAVDEKVALPIIVWNNDCLGQIRDGLLERDIEPIGVTPGRNPDFPAFAKSFGAYGHKATSLSDLTGSVKDAFEADGPTLIEVHENSDFLS
ncbi:MAG: decarboxylase, partial [Rhodospirillaceae bacterium]|nr:decarboxylase [Rhodospirillaceae bacterium]